MKGDQFSHSVSIFSFRTKAAPFGSIDICTTDDSCRFPHANTQSPAPEAKSDRNRGAASRTARHKAGLTRKQLAQAAGIAVQHIGFWERGYSLPNDASWVTLSAILTLEPSHTFGKSE